MCLCVYASTHLCVYTFSGGMYIYIYIYIWTKIKLQHPVEKDLVTSKKFNVFFIVSIKDTIFKLNLKYSVFYLANSVCFSLVM